MQHDRDRARAYFDKLAPEYNRAFEREGRDPVNGLVNRFFRGQTFKRRMELFESLFCQINPEGQSVLDLGCGSGQVSLLAASMGAQVHGIDIASSMLTIAQKAAEQKGLASSVCFEEGDITEIPLPGADMTLLIGVIEYYRDFAPLIQRAAQVTRQRLIIAHTNRVLYRMLLRRLLFLREGTPLYFHPLSDVVDVARAAGFSLEQQTREHAFTLFTFRRG